MIYPNHRPQCARRESPTVRVLPDARRRTHVAGIRRRLLRWCRTDDSRFYQPREAQSRAEPSPTRKYDVNREAATQSLPRADPPAFCSTEFLERFGSEYRKDIRPGLVSAFERGNRLLRQVHDMSLGILSPRFGNRPNSLREIELLSLQTGNLLTTLAGKRQEFNDATIMHRQSVERRG